MQTAGEDERKEPQGDAPVGACDDEATSAGGRRPGGEAGDGTACQPSGGAAAGTAEGGQAQQTEGIVRGAFGLEPAAAEELTRLSRELLTHDGRRIRGERPDGERQAELARACCLALVAGPPELGVEKARSTACETALSTLAAAAANDLPEAHVCRLWLSCAGSDRWDDRGDEFLALARTALWEPVAGLARRALAYFGRREELGDLLGDDREFTVAEADAWLDASHVRGFEARSHGVGQAADSLVRADVQEKWSGVLSAEFAMACGTVGAREEDALKRAAGTDAAARPADYGESVLRRIAGRAVAALVRLRIGRHTDDYGALSGPAAAYLPGWERMYLEALNEWVKGNTAGAVGELQRAMDRNPRQTAVRVALATLIAGREGARALDVLSEARATREMHVTRAIILCRSGRYGEAEASLEEARGSSTRGEAARFTWPAGLRHLRARECALRTALAERRGDWPAAEAAWTDAEAAGLSRSLGSARRFYQAECELKSKTGTGQWRRSEIERRARRLAIDMSAIPLVGSAVFFRGAAQSDKKPELAAKDFKRLCAMHSWGKRECRAGGGRLVYAGDALAGLGCVTEAERVYKLASDAGSAEAVQRLAMTRLWRAVIARTGPAAVSTAAQEAMRLQPSNPWPYVISAVGLLLLGDGAGAAGAATEAQKRGAPEPVCKCLGALSSAVSGRAEPLSDRDVKALRLPPEAEAALRLTAGEGEVAARLVEFMRVNGDAWASRCAADAEEISAKALGDLCRAKRWSEALAAALAIERSGADWARRLAVLARVRIALAKAEGNPAGAEADLRAVEAALSKG